MSLNWDFADDLRRKRVARSQPLRVDWVCLLAWTSAGLLGLAWLWILALAVKQIWEAL